MLEKLHRCLEVSTKLRSRQYANTSVAWIISFSCRRCEARTLLRGCEPLFGLPNHSCLRSSLLSHMETPDRPSLAPIRITKYHLTGASVTQGLHVGDNWLVFTRAPFVAADVDSSKSRPFMTFSPRAYGKAIFHLESPRKLACSGAQASERIRLCL
ncbi:hypothetical protein EJ06DRAFT_127135 [Trichodelitschia bisporula]|uniref:Uncharacterized protein n=1 Tax=Trichodelitschia bisporula TaxID=703511 RepID=A0A6G1HQ98_9PEZI|nr:hypothetical protein EJ06DRAFT_127135 [Trichodelitschia bisporula]